MRYVTFVTAHCCKQAHHFGQHAAVEALAHKVEHDQSVANWEPFLPHPIIKKSLGKSYRLIAEQYNVEETVVICFLDVLPKAGADYEQFLVDPKAFCEKRMPSQAELAKHELEHETHDGAQIYEPSDLEYTYLYTSLNTFEDRSSIYESKEWVQKIREDRCSEYLSRYYDLVLNALEPENNNEPLLTYEKGGISILFRHVDKQHLFLICPLLPGQSPDPALSQKYDREFNSAAPNASTQHLLRLSHRSYPRLVLDSEELWRGIEANKEGNLALSPEETEILESIRHPDTTRKAFPLFINGRPGSGKSTILQYLFAEHLYFHLRQAVSGNACRQPPLYLTYGAKLLETAKSAVQTIIRCNYHMALEESTSKSAIDFDAPHTQHIIDKSFAEFHKFLLTTLPQEDQERFDTKHQVGFSKFRQLWNDRRRDDPDKQVRRLSPELVWHVIRSYIKGMSDDLGNYLDPDSYIELPDARRTVPLDTYTLIYEKVWESWYKTYCEERDLWDAQDLTRTVLNLADSEISCHPAVFCDEAQDFTRIELELISKLSLFSARDVRPEHLYRIPFAFAGDPYQTLNPTGFDWTAVRSGFHERVIQQLDRFKHGNLAFNYRELSYNYRSTSNVVRFCNLLQILRGIAFDIKDLIPQQVWFDDQDSPMPCYCAAEDPATQERLEEQTELVVILPCHEGEEESYVSKDPLLARISANTAEPRNFLSAMSAKGLEFSRVVLYKFGEEYAKEYPELLSPLNEGYVHNCTHDDLLPMQYFLNRLYVAASRAKKRLIIVDTQQGINELWEHSGLRDFDNLLHIYADADGCWTIDDLAYVQSGVDANWSEDRDDPLTIAMALDEAGTGEGDPYKLRLAAANYRRAGQDAHADLCDAKRLELQQEYSSAGAIYLRLARSDQALDCFWRSRSYLEIVNGPFPESPRHRAAVFMEQARSAIECEHFLEYLTRAIQGPNANELRSDERWLEVSQKLVTRLSTIQNEQFNWKRAYSGIKILTEGGIRLAPSIELARVAYRAESYKDAIAIWDSAKEGSLPRDDEPLYARAMAKASDYPDSLKWLQAIDDYAEIIRLWRQNSERALSEAKHIAVIVDAFLHEADIDGAVTVLESQLKQTNRGEKILAVAEPYLDDWVKRGTKEGTTAAWFIRVARLAVTVKCQRKKWRDAIKLIMKLEQHAEAGQQSRLIFIREVAMADTGNEENFATREAIKDLIKSSISPWKANVSIQLVGAALEYNNTIVDALVFYESVWDTKKVPADSSIRHFAKERWLKCKTKQASLARQSSRKYDEYLSEIRRRSEDWGIEPKSLPQFPDRKSLSTLGQEATPSHPEEIIKQDIPADTADLIRDLTNRGWSQQRIAVALNLSPEIVHQVTHEQE